MTYYYFDEHHNCFIEAQSGTSLNIGKGFDNLFIHKNERGGWTVSEARSGRRISHGSLAIDAIKSAKYKLKGLPKSYQRLNEQHIERFGISPAFLKR